MEGKTAPEGYVYPSMEGIKMACVLAIVLTIARFTFERLVLSIKLTTETYLSFIDVNMLGTSG